MRVANLSDRLARARRGRRASTSSGAVRRALRRDPQAIYERWDEFAAWAGGRSRGGEPFDAAALGPPVPRPRQVFALGLNYALHAREAGFELPPMPLTFTKFPSCLTGPDATVEVATDAAWTGRSSSSR